MRTIISILAVGFLIANVCVAAGHRGGPACCGKTHECCNGCGVRKTCKVVRGMKKVKKTVWVVECEEFCASLPGCGHGCKSSCGGCNSGCGGASCSPCEKPLVRPKCGKVRCRKKLVKKTITREVPTYKCIVVCCNDGCNVCSSESDWEEDAPSKAPVPPKNTARAAPFPSRVGEAGGKAF